LQFVAVGKFFAMTVRVFESGTGNPVRGATVNFQVVVERPPDGNPVVSIGDTALAGCLNPGFIAGHDIVGLDGLATIQRQARGFREQ